MTRKTVKDLDKEINKIKEEHQDLKNNFDTLSGKYEALEIIHNHCVSKSKVIFNCNLCDQKFKKQGDLKEHKISKNAKDVTFSCNECDRLFTEEWKLKANLVIMSKCIFNYLNYP